MGSARQCDAHASAMRTALPRHDTLLRQCINDHDGHVFKTGGDAFLRNLPYGTRGARSST